MQHLTEHEQLAPAFPFPKDFILAYPSSVQVLRGTANHAICTFLGRSTRRGKEFPSSRRTISGGRALDSVTIREANRSPNSGKRPSEIASQRAFREVQLPNRIADISGADGPRRSTRKVRPQLVSWCRLNYREIASNSATARNQSVRCTRILREWKFGTEEERLP
jgi:hypothetical protein